MSKRQYTFCVIHRMPRILLTIAFACLSAPTHCQVTNPAIPYTADPYLITVNGLYYFMATDSANVAIRAASSVTELGNITPVTVFSPGTSVLSPSLWYFPNYSASQPWFIIFQGGASGSSSDAEVLQSDGTDPLGTYHVSNGAICGGYCGDPGYLQWNGSLYLISTDLAQIYLTPLSDPATTTGSRSPIITKRPAPADYSTDWEWANNDQFGCCIEGAYPWVYNGQLSMSFSGNRYQNNEYATGISKFNGGDILNEANWEELDSPSQSTFGGYAGASNGVWGAAAVRGWTSPGDSTQVWMVYAGYQQYCEFCGVSRQSFVQPISWKSDNTPDFGLPLGTSTTVPLPAGDPGPGLITNPGFESPGFSTNNIPGWSVWTADNGASANAAFTESYGNSHSGSWHLAEWKPSPYQLSVYQDIYLPNGQHTVTAWIETTGGQADAHMELHNYTSPDQFAKAYPQVDPNNYHQVSLTVKATTGKVTIGFYSDEPVGYDWMRVDDVAIQ